MCNCREHISLFFLSHIVSCSQLSRSGHSWFAIVYVSDVTAFANLLQTLDAHEYFGGLSDCY